MRPQVSPIRKSLVAIILSVVLLIASLMFPTASTNLRMTAWGVIEPMVLAVSAPTTAFGRLLETFGDVQSLHQTIQSLQQENIDLKSKVAVLTSQEAQNTQLRQQLELVAKTPIDKYSRVAADIIGQNSRQRKKWIIINKGASDGVEIGNTVIINARALVGKVVEVGANTAKVQLSTASKSVIRVVTSKHGTMGIARGVADLGMRLTYVNRTEPLADGDYLITPESENIPSGLLVGVVREVAPSVDGLFNEAAVVPLHQLRYLSVVYVLRKIK